MQLSRTNVLHTIEKIHSIGCLPDEKFNLLPVQLITHLHIFERAKQDSLFVLDMVIAKDYMMNKKQTDESLKYILRSLSPPPLEVRLVRGYQRGSSDIMYAPSQPPDPSLNALPFNQQPWYVNETGWSTARFQTIPQPKNRDDAISNIDGSAPKENSLPAKYSSINFQSGSPNTYTDIDDRNRRITPTNPAPIHYPPNFPPTTTSSPIIPDSVVRTDFSSPATHFDVPVHRAMTYDPRVGWTFPYYQCGTSKWVVTMVILVDKESDLNDQNRVYLTVDFDVSWMDVNQCPVYPNERHLTDMINNSSTYSDQSLDFFHNTHKCPKDTECIHVSGKGWRLGSYTCTCSKGYYLSNNSFKDSNLPNSSTDYHHTNITCLACAPGCNEVNAMKCRESNTPCLATYNWPFRIALLTISIFCIGCTLLLMLLVYRWQRVQVFKMASPIFISICLTGCIVMYSEMAAIFPILNRWQYCVATKWTRHMGFCITFSALLMKTWR